MVETISARVSTATRNGETIAYLVPTTRQGLRQLQRLAEEDRPSYMVKISRGRSTKRNSWWHAMVQAAADALDRDDLPFEVLREVLKLKAGAVHVVSLRNGDVVTIPRSLAFHRMDEEAFAAFCDRTLRVICYELLPQMERGDLLERVKDIAFLRERPK